MQSEVMSSEEKDWSRKMIQHSVGQWVIKNRFYLFLTVVSVIILTVIFFQLAPFFGRGKQNGYVSAELVYAHWKESPTNPDLFTRLESYLKRYPELTQKYDGPIAQEFINVGEPAKAYPFAIKNLERVKGDAPYFSDYGATTLLLSKGEYAQALREAQDLKERMVSDPDFQIREDSVVPVGSFLYAWNLIRIAFLQMQHQNYSGELDAWNSLEDFLGWDEGISKHPRVSEMILRNFQEKDITLPDYIAYRKRMLLTK